MDKMIEKLLEPISLDSPCGEDLWLTEGRRQLQQPVEQSWREGSEVKWSEVGDAALGFLQRSRDLRASILLSLALFRTQGFPGLGDGLALIHGLMERHWDHLHPLPEGRNDPTRENALSNLSARLGSETAYQFVKYLRETPLCRSAAGTGYSLADLDRAEGGRPQEDPEARPAASLDQIEAVLRAEANRANVRETRQQVAGILSRVEAIETLAGKKSGPEGSLSLEALKETLQNILQRLPQPESDPAPEVRQHERTDASADARHAIPQMTGSIRTRAEAEAALAAAADYFRRCEPSSPLPFLLERARRLLRMDFMQTMRDLAPAEALERFNLLFGIKEPDSAAGEEKNENK